MSSQVLRKFAEELKSKREDKGITLHQIRNKTRLDIKFLEAIEEGNFHIMPEVYIRAFIKEYALAIGVDPEATMEKYDLAKEGKYVEEKEIPVEKKDVDDKIDERKFDAYEEEKPPLDDSPAGRRKNTYLPYIIGSAVIAVVILAYFIFIRSGDQNIVVEKPLDEILQQKEKRYELSAEDTTALIADSLLLEITAVDTAWVKYRIDGSVSSEIIILPGRSKQLKGSSTFYLTIGNAGGINLSLDGNKLNLEGRKGQVRMVKVDSSGLTYISSGVYNE